MFIRTKERRGHVYLVLVENYRLDGKVRQRTMRNFGRLDRIDPRAVRQVLATYSTFRFLAEPIEPSPSAPRGADTDGSNPGGRTEPVQHIRKGVVGVADEEGRYAEFDHL